MVEVHPLLVVEHGAVDAVAGVAAEVGLVRPDGLARQVDGGLLIGVVLGGVGPEPGSEAGFGGAP